MEDKKKIKVSLSSIITLILIAIIIGMGFYIYKLNKDKYYMTIGASKQIEELNDKIDNLEDKIKKDENKENVKLEENNEDIILDAENNSVKTVDNVDLILNGQIVEINKETKRFKSEKVSFQFPKSWMISQCENSIKIISPISSIRIEMWFSDDYNFIDVKDALEQYNKVEDEGYLKVSGKSAYFKEHDYEDEASFTKSKHIVVDLGNGEYCDIVLDIESNYNIHDYSEKELLEIYDEYEPIFDNIVSTLKFEK